MHKETIQADSSARCAGRVGMGRTMGEELLVGPAYARKKASDGLEYLAEMAEDKDLAYLVENSCIHCNRLIGKGEVKIMPPSYIQERDSYVSAGVVRKRLMCVNCYNEIRYTAREKIKFDRYKNASRIQNLRNAIGRFLTSR